MAWSDGTLLYASKQPFSSLVANPWSVKASCLLNNYLDDSDSKLSLQSVNGFHIVLTRSAKDTMWSQESAVKCFAHCILFDRQTDSSIMKFLARTASNVMHTSQGQKASKNVLRSPLIPSNICLLIHKPLKSKCKKAATWIFAVLLPDRLWLGTLRLTYLARHKQLLLDLWEKSKQVQVLSVSLSSAHLLLFYLLIGS